MAWREAVKKPVAKPTAPKPKFDTKDDDWETDIKYEVQFDLNKKKFFYIYLFKQNQTDEKTQRYGATSIPGSGRIDHVDFKSIQEKVRTADNTVRQVYQDKNPNRGYGGKFGTDQVMDKVNPNFYFFRF